MFDFDSLKFNNSIKDILTDNKVVYSDKFKCLECNDLIYKKELYQCKNGDCIKCGSCWEEQLLDKTNIKCDVIEFKDLARMKTTEISFGEKKVFCPFSFKFNKKEKDIGGCNEILEIKNLETHLSNCEYRFIKCDNKSNVIGEDCCGFIVRKNNVEDHKEECKYKIFKCNLCKNEMIRSIYETHELDCPSFIIDCYQCSMKLERKELQNHVNKNCNETIIQCLFKEFGCSSKIKRYQFQSHIDEHNEKDYEKLPLFNKYKNKNKELEIKYEEIKNEKEKLQLTCKKLKERISNKETYIKELETKLKLLSNRIQKIKDSTYILNDFKIFNFKLSSKIDSHISKYDNNKKLKIKIEKNISFHVRDSVKSEFNIFLKINHPTDPKKDIYYMNNKPLSFNKEKYKEIPFLIPKKSLKDYLSDNEIKLIYSFNFKNL